MNLYEKALELIDAARPFALATVIRSSGSTPQKAGAKALFERSGEVHGTLGGGCLEAESRRRALLALEEGKSEAFDISLDSDYGWDDGLICGGKVRVFVDVIPQKSRAAIEGAAQALARREKGVIHLRIQPAGSTSGVMTWIPEAELGAFDRYPGAEAIRNCLDDEHTRYFKEEGGDECFMEPFSPMPRLIIAGGGHVGKATAKLGSFLGFEVTVIDDRRAFANPGYIPEAAQTICGDIAAELAALDMGPDTYVVIVTRGHRHDATALAACVNKPAAFIGMIGSKRKVTLIRKKLAEEGVASEERIRSVYSPIGIDIGARTVEEIALSIAAQLVAVRRKKEYAAHTPLSTLSL